MDDQPGQDRFTHRPGVENLPALRPKLLRVLQQHRDRRSRCPSGASSVDRRGQRASLVECMPHRSETTGPSLRLEDLVSPSQGSPDQWPTQVVDDRMPLALGRRASRAQCLTVSFSAPGLCCSLVQSYAGGASFKPKPVTATNARSSREM